MFVIAIPPKREKQSNEIAISLCSSLRNLIMHKGESNFPLALRLLGNDQRAVIPAKAGSQYNLNISKLPCLCLLASRRNGT